jgi:hypothetical protein
MLLSLVSEWEINAEVWVQRYWLDWKDFVYLQTEISFSFCLNLEAFNMVHRTQVLSADNAYIVFPLYKTHVDMVAYSSTSLRQVFNYTKWRQILKTY